jgi:hypothetical protein
MVRKNSAKQPIGPGKAGTLKRAVFKGGGGKKTLATLRGASKAQRKMVASTPGVDVKGYAKAVRAAASGTATRRTMPVNRPRPVNRVNKTQGWPAGSAQGRTSKR